MMMSGDEDMIKFTNAVELLIDWNFSEEVQLAFLNGGVELNDMMNMGLQQLQQYVPDDKERLRLITCIFKRRRQEISANTSGGDSAVDVNQSRSPSPADSSGSDFNPDTFLNSNDNIRDSDSSDDVPLIKKVRRATTPKFLLGRSQKGNTRSTNFNIDAQSAACPSASNQEDLPATGSDAGASTSTPRSATAANLTSLTPNGTTTLMQFTTPRSSTASNPISRTPNGTKTRMKFTASRSIAADNGSPSTSSVDATPVSTSTPNSGATPVITSTPNSGATPVSTSTPNSGATPVSNSTPNSGATPVSNSTANSGAEVHESPVVNLSGTDEGPGDNQSASSSPVPSRLQTILLKNHFLEFKYLKENTLYASIFVGNKNGILTTENRALLVKAVTEKILNVTTSPSQDDFKILRSKIYDIFPNEPEGLYYNAPKELGIHQRLARGKLFDKVRNEISKLIKKKALSRRRNRTPLSDSNTGEEEINVPGASTETQGAITILKRSRAITDDVVEKWKVSADFRLKELYRKVLGAKRRQRISKGQKQSAENNEPDFVGQYFEEFKILKCPTGYLLLVSDFKQKYEKECNNLFSAWPAFQKKLEEIALLSNIDDPVGNELLKRLKASKPQSEVHFEQEEEEHEELVELDENSKDALLLQLLPSLCPPTARVEVGKKTFKPSILEARDAFISFTTVAADIEPLVERIRKRLTDLRAPMQPFMIFQGPNRWTITAVYIAFDRILYRLDSILHCLDICCKVFHSACLSYPKEANHLWHILHLFVYKVKHDPSIDGDVPLSTMSFIAKLNSL